jgi:hypothetical protein
MRRTWLLLLAPYAGLAWLPFLQQTIAGAVRVPVFLLVSIALGPADHLDDLSCLQEHPR